MGMAERGSMLPGLIVLAGPELMLSPGRTPCGARTYDIPLKSPPDDPACVGGSQKRRPYNAAWLVAAHTNCNAIRFWRYAPLTVLGYMEAL